ncbi:EAL domain-containing protein [Vibrio coralliirubri]|uniref:EAL domain-containing protein n=1 Tax=Vibrio coralliirubri TaxID=1516159 RepID=UPI000637FBA1|nr:EAL domain-containing protein [Vibrio coralliirubri]CDU12402.1 putative Response regulator VieA [Vibrio coralliirubri]
MKILIIEDDRIQAISLKLLLNDLGIAQITIAHTSKSALDFCTKDKFNHIFCDIQLPDSDGILLLRDISKCQRSAIITILSSSETSVIKLTYLACKTLKFKGVNSLKKPFTHNSISKIVLASTPNTTQYLEHNKPQLTFTESEVVTAIENDEIFYYYQPQVDFQTEKIVGVEALVRWDHPELGVLTPNHFLSYITKSEHYNLLFCSVLNKSIRAIQSLNLTTSIKLSVNFTQRDLECSDICNEIIKTCEREGFNYKNLVLELTESHIYSSDANSLINLARLKLLGVKLAIDDFGTGYSSLEKITQIPFDILKIDRSFVRNVIQDYQNASIVKLCIGTAKAMHLNVVVEGIEDADTWQYIKNMGADECQGYFTGRPMSIHDLQQALVKQKTTSEVKKLNVLVIDDQPIIGVALKNALIEQQSVENAHCVTTPQLALDCMRDNVYNLIIVDVNLTDESGFHLVERVRQTEFSGRVIFISGEDNPLYDSLCQGLGAIYITKSLELNEMIEKIIYYGGQNTGETPLINTTPTPLDSLSVREREVLRQLLDGVGNKAIANHLNISQKTVSTYKSRLLQKLNAKSLIDLSKYSKSLQT